MKEIPGPVKAILAALSLAVTIALGTGAYAFTNLASRVEAMDAGGSTALRERTAVSSAEISFLRESLKRIEEKLDRLIEERRK
jgi:hypothetical protein